MDANEQLLQKRALSLQGGGAKKMEAQHKRGKLSARERIDLLVDPGSFFETDAFVVHDCQDFGMNEKRILGDGVITGWATIDSRLVYLFAHDFTVFGGSLSAAFAKKICKIMDLALQNGAPVIGLNDSGGARIHEGVASLGGYADIFYRNVQSSGVIPQISIIAGPCAGGAVYSPAITDVTFMVEDTSHMFITGPDVVKSVTGEEVNFEDLGGARIHSQTSGVADHSYPTEQETFEAVRRWLSFVPSNNLDSTPTQKPQISEATLEKRKQTIRSIVPEGPDQPYKMSEVIEAVVDPDSFWQQKENYAPNLITAFARLDGQSVGIIANNPWHLAGALDLDASVKGARFVRFCDAFHIPLITFVDVPGFLPGVDQERGGIIRHGAKLLYAFCEASVPRLTVITRKAYGGAYDVMNSKHIGADLNLAWPNAEIAVMGAPGACEIIFHHDIKASSNPEEVKQQKTNEYSKVFATPYQAAERGYIDSVILPEETRDYLIQGLFCNKNKRKNSPNRKHGNIPL